MKYIFKNWGLRNIFILSVIIAFGMPIFIFTFILDIEKASAIFE